MQQYNVLLFSDPHTNFKYTKKHREHRDLGI